MNIKKINERVLKDVIDKKGKYTVEAYQGKILINDRVNVWILDQDDFYIKIATIREAKWAKSLIFNSSTNYLLKKGDLVKIDNKITVQKLLLPNGKDIWVDVKLLDVYSSNVTFEGLRPNLPVFAFENRELVGVLMSIARK